MRAGNDKFGDEVTRPLVESMEGAAFMYACLIHDVPFAQVRAVSNVVERRNRATWKMDEAIRNLGVAAVQILNSLPEDPSGLTNP
jgi:futalosine hydrolase